MAVSETAGAEELNTVKAAGGKSSARRAISGSLTSAGLAVLCLCMLASFSVYLTPRLGWRVDGLRSGSMSPEMNTGDLVITRPLPPQRVSVGDIIVFRAPGNSIDYISHRVIGITETPLSFTTKGDANATPDPFTTPARDVFGIVAFHLPLLGYAVLFLQTELGLVAGLVLPGAAVALICLRGIRDEIVKKKLEDRS